MARLLALTGLARSVYGRWRFNQILLSLLGIAIATIVMAVIIGVGIAAASQGMYAVLVEGGASPVLAALVIVGLFALVLLALLYIIAFQLQRIRSSLRINRPASNACEIVDAFLDGLTGNQ